MTDPMRGHEYDGITELDNDLPRWWLYLFYLTIAFAAGYYGYYELGSGKTILQSFEAEQQERAQLLASLPPEDDAPKEQAVLAVLQDPAGKSRGKAVFEARCVSCHGPQGQGGIGPNLTDHYWLHGGKIGDIASTVTKGVLDKGMPAWKNVISDPELVAVVAYVRSIRGNQPANPKAPQGELFKE